MTGLEQEKPLKGLTVLDFSQFLSGPSAGLRLADLGARVIKVEKKGTGDICRTLYISNTELEGESTLFHAINRNKESIELDLKNEEDAEIVKALIKKADIMIENFRPGVMERLGLDYQSVKAYHEKIIYGEITGYGNEGPWRDKPGQDLLVQSLSGLTWLNGNDGDPPLPFGLSIIDMIAGEQLTQGILAAMVRRAVSGKGAYVQVSLLEAIVDLQFELLTTYLQDDHQLPVRSKVNNAHPYIAAPYGIYETQDGYLALAMGSVTQLGELLQCEALKKYENPVTWSTHRDKIKQILVEHLKTKRTKEWLHALERADYWCAEVLNWHQLLEHEGFHALNMIQKVERQDHFQLLTTRCPIRIDGEIYQSSKPAPFLGENTAQIIAELT
ncbi:CoA transferase [Alkalihalobacillus oceani]|uniref:CoA transferase n=1 Tax=Halalkalibacter oceani TaxID=1653776 RepID=A0A9X2IPR2_9BACI|nr:CaiB/BaiF CoA-transferase family protein [Halalkalibacter oceani]MCM3715520.1 CoA transferase [Halalkalibacter oceani]